MNKPTLLNPKMLRTVGVFGIAVAATLLLVATVFSHADYERSEPVRDEVLPVVPERVDVFFSQDVVKREGAFYVRVFDETGAQVSDEDGLVNDDDRANIYAELPTGLGSGRYIVEWMTTSDVDGEVDDGAFCFYVGVKPTADQSAQCAELAEDDHPDPTVDATEPTEAADDPSPTVAAPSDRGDDDDGSNTGLTVGIIVVIVAVAVVAIGGFVWMSRRD